MKYPVIDGDEAECWLPVFNGLYRFLPGICFRGYGIGVKVETTVALKIALKLSREGISNDYPQQCFPRF
jgi:hypothetical protein